MVLQQPCDGTEQFLTGSHYQCDDQQQYPEIHHCFQLAPAYYTVDIQAPGCPVTMTKLVHVSTLNYGLLQSGCSSIA